MKYQVKCLVCNSTNVRPLFETPDGAAFTSAQVATKSEQVTISICDNCSHAQTPPIENIEEYYSRLYNFQANSIEEEDLYEVRSGKEIYRSEHQAYCVQDRFDLSRNLRVLDYGCAKAKTLKRLVVANPNIIPYVFDVSDTYTHFWNEFVPVANQSVNSLGSNCLGSMDITLSFFALEHTADPRGFVREIASTLRDGGVAHVLVPNMYQNISDLIVADHVNHFSPISLRTLFEEEGFGEVVIDQDSHRAVFIVNAKRVSGAQKSNDFGEVPNYVSQAFEIARKWQSVVEQISIFEALAVGKPAAIFGSGVYGMFVASSLRDKSAVRYFLDSNPFRQGKRILGIPVVSPSAVDADVSYVYVGLNPQIASSVVHETPGLLRQDRQFCYL